MGITDELMKRINNLPTEIINQIKIYIPGLFLIFVNKSYYFENHTYLLKEIYLQKRYDKYVRKLICRDNYFVFHLVLRENSKYNGNALKKYLYKNNEYTNFYYFLIDYCIEHEAAKCRNVLNEYLLEEGLCQNRDKKYRLRSIRWKT